MPRKLLSAFKMKKIRTYSKYATEAVTLLGERIKLERKRRQWSETSLAERAGISRATLQKIETGEMSCAIGLVFEVATLVGVTLFESDLQPLARNIQHTRETLSLMPKRIRTKKEEVDDDF